ncbi:hypothetical protein AYL99_11176 [Fonsecaea erecta]|uniref:Uncharacterized protein n=1 Tax=Fonsecaea erecta TaxID=1367422 RepID=A0A178Z4P7_9EURO|nr:hypothetical protein AYL99_11176 [Fonsecaea erecta]OAP54728.1 hypothetical protein AYL99_11176 [Fonsecaea erecta]
MDNDRTSALVDKLTAALARMPEESAQETGVVVVSDYPDAFSASATASAIAVTALRSADDASGANAPPGAESDQDTQTKFAISQIPTDIRNTATFTNTYHEFPLTIDAHRAFLKEFKDSWGFGQLRHDYFSTARKIAIRMGTIFQTIFVWNVGDNITNDLRIRKYHPDERIADFAVKIKQRTDLAVDFTNEGSWHVPDLAFAHADAYYPGVVIEASYAAQTLPFAELAQQYIQKSAGEIKVVVGLEIEYPAAKQGKIMVWKEKEGLAGATEAELVVDENFRHGEGTMNPDCKGLYLRLSDFCPDHMIPAEVKPLIAAPKYLGHDTGIHISASDLNYFVNIALQHHQRAEAHYTAQEEEQQQQQQQQQQE